MKAVRAVAACVCMLALAVVLAGCGGSGSSSAAGSATSESASQETSASAESSSVSSSAQSGDSTLAPGTYSAKFQTDSGMFHVNETLGDRGELTVSENGSMVIHVSLQSKKIVNLYAGTAAEAQSDEAGQIQPTTDSVTYSDGKTGEVYGFDIPVPALDEKFDVALLGEKGKWYDHKVIVSDPVAK